MKKFTKSFSSPDAVPESGIENALRMMQSGHLFRYNPVPNPQNIVTQAHKQTLFSDVSLLEKEFCEYTGHKYAVAVNSCGSAMFLALKATGLQHGQQVFSNAFTFTAVPSSIVHAGGVPIYIECTSDYVVDIADFREKVKAHPEVRYFLLSYMRGHISDVGEIQQICRENGICLIEDCAHSLGVRWHEKDTQQDEHIGHYGSAACFSAQSNKLINAGEGGILVTNDADLATYAILAAGSYELLYQQHIARPDDEKFEKIKLQVPNFSVRMNNLTAAILRPQLLELDEKIDYYNQLYQELVKLFDDIPQAKTPNILPQVARVGDSFQFNLIDMSVFQVQTFLQRANQQGIALQVFGHSDNSRYFRNWAYSFDQVPQLDQTERVITAACDFRIPMTFDLDDVRLIAEIIQNLLDEVMDSDSIQNKMRA